MKIFIALLLATCTLCLQAQSPDEIAIKKLIHDETLAFSKGDLDAFMACYANKPYTHFSAMTGAPGAAVLIAADGWETIRAAFKPYFESAEGKAMSANFVQPNRSDWMIEVRGNTAWAKYNQSAASGKSLELRVLEKIDGQWKMVMKTTLL
jgi:ketosteroid isomerase-like protein